MPCFEAHQPAPPSSSPPASESSFVSCHALKLTNPSSLLLPFNLLSLVFVVARFLSPPPGSPYLPFSRLFKLTNPLLPLPPIQFVSPPFSRAIFQSSPTIIPLLPPSTLLLLASLFPCFKAHQPVPPSSSPPVGESSFVSCHVSKLTNPLLPLPPLQLVSPRLCHAML